MNRDFFKRSLIILFVFLLAASVSVNIVAAETIYQTNRTTNTLILINPDFNSTASYKIDITGNISYLGSPHKQDVGRLEIKLNDLNFPFQVSITGANINESLTIHEPALDNNPKSPSPSPTLTHTPSSTPSSAPANGTKGSSTIFGIELVYYIIVAVFILILTTGWYLLKLEMSGRPESRPKNPSPKNPSPKNPSLVTSNYYPLQIDLTDESGFVRIQNAGIKAVNKNGTSQPAILDRDGIFYKLELPKGNYKIEVDGGDNYENTSKEVNIPEDDSIRISLIKRHILQIEVVDDSGTPVRGISVRVKEIPAGTDIKDSPAETDNSGIARFTISKNKKYVASARSLTEEFTNQENIPIDNSETTKRIQLIRRTGTLEINVTEQATGKAFAGIPVAVMKKGTNQIKESVTDSTGKINQKLPVGDYIIRLRTGSSPLYESIEKYAAVNENRTAKVVLDFRFNYQPKQQYLNAISAINEKLNTSLKEVSTYDTCIPLFFKKVGEKPLQLIDKIIKRPVEFLNSKTTPDEIISCILSVADSVSDEISGIMREKSNVDFYFSIQNLQPVDDLAVSDYSPEKFSELVHDTANYHKNHFREIGNKLSEIDTQITQLSGTLTIQPVADLWRVAQKLQEKSNNEPDEKKRGVMLFINDKLLDHVREMYNKDEVKARLKFTMV